MCGMENCERDALDKQELENDVQELSLAEIRLLNLIMEIIVKSSKKEYTNGTKKRN